jgi:hypothetical protein
MVTSAQIPLVELLSIISSVVSLILGVLAIILSVVFFIQSKKAEKESSNALESIKGQTDALQKITARQMDRLTRYATEPNPSTDLLIQMISIIKEFPNVSQSFTSPGETAQKEQIIAELITAYIGMYYYSAIANVATQSYLPPIVQYDDNKELNGIFKDIINRSYNDFQVLGQILRDKVHPTRIQANALFHLYNDTENNWKQFVKDATQVYADRESRGLQ